MNFLKRLFSSSKPQNPVMFFYVRPKRCDEIVPVRIDLYNELSLTDEDQYYVRKLARAIRCPFPAELEAYFDKNRRFQNAHVSDGELVDEAAYKAWVAASGQKTGV